MRAFLRHVMGKIEAPKPTKPARPSAAVERAQRAEAAVLAQREREAEQARRAGEQYRAAVEEARRAAVAFSGGASWGSGTTPSRLGGSRRNPVLEFIDRVKQW